MTIKVCTSVLKDVNNKTKGLLLANHMASETILFDLERQAYFGV